MTAAHLERQREARAVSLALVRWRQARLLGPLLARAIRWLPILAGGLVALLPVHLALGGFGASVPELVDALRISAVVLSVGAAGVIDDPTEETTAHQPMPLLLRRTVRLALAAPTLALLWLVAVGYAGSSPSVGPLPVAALTLELAALLAVTLAAAAVATRWVPEGLGGLAAAPATLALAAAALLLPPRYALFVPYPSVGWVSSHQRWWAILLAAVVLFAYSSRDPGRVRLRAIFLTGRDARHGRQLGSLDRKVSSYQEDPGGC